MTLILIAAVAADGAIGRRGDLAFHIRADLRRFKALTMGYTVIMGRKTFDSLPNGALSGRRNIVITRNRNFTAPGVETAASVDEAIALVEGDDEAFIIGGASVYNATIDRADCLELTHIDATAPGADTFFPEVEPDKWQRTDENAPAVDEASGLTYTFATWRRRQ